MVFKLNFGENWFTKSMMYFTFFMFPFCWIVFHFDHLYPREGYFLWTAGMTLMLLYKPK